LLDVLQGTMSLVGPRPEVPRYVAHYPPEVRAIVLSVRPGITDLASIEYRNESAQLAAASDPEHEYLNVVLPAKLALAQRYVSERSLWGDVRIILRTLGAVFR
jgi:lipopolysaccharide/colanic/teichoic acid biosynthesis glycosyltransferase